MPSTTSPSARSDQLDPLELGAWRGFLRTHALLSSELDAELIAAHGLPLRSYEVLLFLNDSRAGEMRMAELAQSALLSRSGLTRLVDRLEREGLVRRESCPGDARGLNAVITPAGRKRFAAARHTHLEGVRRRFLGRLSEDEQRTLAELWERLGSAGHDSPAC